MTFEDGRPVKYRGHTIAAVFNGIDFVAKVDGEAKGTYVDVAAALTAARGLVDRLLDEELGKRAYAGISVTRMMKRKADDKGW